MIAAFVNAPPPHPILIWIGVIAAIVLIWCVVSMGSGLSITVTQAASAPEPQTDEESVQAILHEYAPKSFSHPAAKGWAGHEARFVFCSFCGTELTRRGVALDLVRDCDCAGAVRARARQAS